MKEELTSITAKLSKEAQTAVVILIKTGNDTPRYFNGFRKGNLLNSWSLAGAKLFLPDNPDLSIIENELRESKYQFERCAVGLLKLSPVKDKEEEIKWENYLTKKELKNLKIKEEDLTMSEGLDRIEITLKKAGIILGEDMED